MARLLEKTVSFTAITEATYSDAFDVGDATSISVQVDATETSSADATVGIEKSNDSETWTAEGTPTAISGDATVWVEGAAPNYRFFRLAFAITSGSIDTANCHILAKS